MSLYNTFLRVHPRLLVAAIVGVATYFAVPADSAITRFLAGWNAGVWLYLLSVWFFMVRANSVDVRKLAENEDENAEAVLALVCFASIASLAAIVLELSATKADEAHRYWNYGFTGLTVLGSWFLIGTIFTLHYARLFYKAPDHQTPLQFPGHDKKPDYWDFLYFSFTISVAVQTSDVAVTTRAMRKVVLAHSIVGYLFNAAILGLSINIAAGLV